MTDKYQYLKDAKKPSITNEEEKCLLIDDIYRNLIEMIVCLHNFEKCINRVAMANNSKIEDIFKARVGRISLEC